MKKITSKLLKNITLVLSSIIVLIACNNNKTKTPEITEQKTNAIKLGFIPLTDCASLIMAKELGYFAQEGVSVELSKEASWANLRDKVLTGELSGAHCLYSMPFSVYSGVGGKAESIMKLAMILNTNGQAITLSNKFCDLVGTNEISKVASAVDKLNAAKQVQFAMTFPGGTHDLWLRTWMAATGIDPKKVGIKTIPPPQMVANMKVDNMDGYCVGEPWNGVAVKDGIGFTHIASQEIWKNHPEKALVINEKFSTDKKDDLKKIMKAIIRASQWLDTLTNRKKAAEIISQQKYVNAPVEVTEARLMGTNNVGCKFGEKKYGDDYMKFFDGGSTNYPRKSYGIWALAKYTAWGLVTTAPKDYKAIADKIIMQDVYNEVITDMKIVSPNDDMKPFKLTIESKIFDPNNVAAYIAK
jgi:nitrate/nitrite transport system substrate-binding protein